MAALRECMKNSLLMFVMSEIKKRSLRQGWYYLVKALSVGPGHLLGVLVLRVGGQ